jgi:hypothetical protein
MRILFSSALHLLIIKKRTKMKKLLIIMAGIFFFACSNEKDKDADNKVTFRDLESENLKGDISSVEETPYKADSTGKIGEMDSCCVSITEYDENGNGIKQVSKDSKGNLSRESVLTRHPNGLFKSISNTEKGKSTGGFETKIDDKGSITWAGEIDSNGKAGIYYLDITQNEVGEVTGWKQFDKDSVFRQTGESTYDKHLFMSSTIKDSVGKVKNSNSVKYNDKGEQTENSFTNITKDTTTTTVTKYTYESHDEMGNWNQRTTWNDKGKATGISKRTFIYRNKEAKK